MSTSLFPDTSRMALKKATSFEAAFDIPCLAETLAAEVGVRIRLQLGRFGFGADRAEVAVGKLSGGEKARLLFALMSRAAPPVLILGDPTNHPAIDQPEESRVGKACVTPVRFRGVPS